jgi:hypothetical protein
VSKIIEAVYPYTNESGEVLFEVVRYTPKAFQQRRPDPAALDGYNYSVSGVRRVLYRLPDVIAARENGETVFICEGEKDVAALVERGFCATCNAGGAGKWLDDYTEQLRGADVVLVPDNDDTGRKHAELVAEELKAAAGRIRRIEIPGAKDAHEFFEQGGALKTFHELVESAPDIKPPTLAEIITARRFNPLIEPPPLRPIFSALGIPFATPGNIQTIAAHAKAGKSGWINAMLAAPMATAGVDTLGIKSENRNGFAVLHFDTEQSVDDHWHQVSRAIRRAGRETLPDWIRSYCFTGFSAKQNCEAIWLEAERAKLDCGGVHSILIDGVADLVSDVNDAEECNAFVANLHALAIKLDCPITGVIHINPGSETGKTRGHLGSQLERKAETNLRLDKDGEVTSVWSEKQRRAPILKDKGPRFQWSNEEAMHVTIERGQSPSELAERAAAIELRDEVFNGKPSLRRGEMEKAIGVTTGKSDRTASRIATSWDKLGIIEKYPGGLWAPAACN